mmetsp:Transcript_25697/g.50624  ORF Transcript_25697/g.50624 Transcript_25697/m.50624 type:complete len:82 (-) Transcript_25697:31-276(-)
MTCQFHIADCISLSYFSELILALGSFFRTIFLTYFHQHIIYNFNQTVFELIFVNFQRANRNLKSTPTQLGTFNYFKMFKEQ